jgi:hypothetical protein
LIFAYSEIGKFEHTEKSDMRIMRNLNNKNVKSAKIPHCGSRELPEIQKTFVKSAKIPH